MMSLDYRELTRTNLAGVRRRAIINIQYAYADYLHHASAAWILECSLRENAPTAADYRMYSYHLAEAEASRKAAMVGTWVVTGEFPV